jgi:hypothetical protein
MKRHRPRRRQRTHAAAAESAATQPSDLSRTKLAHIASKEATAAATPLELETDNKRIRKLTQRVQAGHFLTQFAAWHRQQQQQLHAATTVNSTLEALRVWSAFYSCNQSRVEIVLYATAELERLASERSVLGKGTRVLKDWSKRLHRDAEKAANKLRKVQHTSKLISIITHMRYYGHKHRHLIHTQLHKHVRIIRTNAI